MLYINDCLIQADSYDVPAEYEIKSGTRCIASYAFDSCDSLTMVMINKETHIANEVTA